MSTKCVWCHTSCEMMQIAFNEGVITLDDEELCDDCKERLEEECCMQKAARALRTLWNDRANVEEYVDYILPNGSTSKRSEVVLHNIPCRLSFSTIRQVGDGDTAGIEQVTKLFLDPNINIKEGSKITVTRSDGESFVFKRSGKPAHYPELTHHQEIVLVPYKEKA